MLVRLRGGTLAALLACASVSGVRASGAQQPTGDSRARQVGAPPRTVLTIGEARDRIPSDDDTITVAGRAVVSSGVYQVRAFEIAIGSPSGGLRVYSRTAGDSVAAGDSVEATGVLRRYRGDLQIVASGVRVVPGASRRVMPVPVRLRHRDVATRSGRLARVTGRVVAKGTNDGGQWLRLASTNPADSMTLDVWVSRSSVAGIDLARFETGEVLEVTGVLLTFRDGPNDPAVYQIAPRGPDDLSVQGIPRRWYRWAAIGVAGLLLLAAAGWVGSRASARRNARRVEEIEERYRQLLHLLPDAVVVHAGGRVLFTNPAAARLFEVDDERALVGRNVEDFLAPESRTIAHGGQANTPTDSLGVARQRGQVVGERGTVVEVEAATAPCRYHDQPATMLLARDITEQLRFERDLHALAVRDDLTGLHNRRGFTLFADQEIARARRYGHSAFLLFADLNGLKAINDEFGHAAGDHALRVMSRALRSVVRESDVVARWGGDEFVALVFQSEAGVDIDSIGERLNETMRRLASESLPFAVSASVGGSALDPATVTDFASAIDRADSDLYRRRQLVRNRSRDLV